MPTHQDIRLDLMLRDILARMDNIEILIAEVEPSKGPPTEPMDIVLR